MKVVTRLPFLKFFSNGFIINYAPLWTHTYIPSQSAKVHANWNCLLEPGRGGYGGERNGGKPECMAHLCINTGILNTFDIRLLHGFF